MFSRTVKALVIAGLCSVFLAVDGHAQGATPENTVIRNIATASFTDANGNTYSSVADTVDVTVGFVAGVDVAGAATATPLVGSTGDTLTFTLQNLGNGTDSLSVSTTSSATVMTVTGYWFNGTTYPSVAALNAVLAGFAIPQDSTITIKVVYDVPAGSGGLSGNFTMTGTSRRDPTKTDSAVTTVSPILTVDVAVTPDDSAIQVLPNSATVPSYTFTFYVKNTGNGPEDYNVAASNANPSVITSATPSISSISGLAAGDSVAVVVTYVVGNVAASSVDTLYLSATSVTNPSIVDSGSAIVTVVRPALTIVKEAYRDNQTTLIGAADSVVPQEFIQYKITVTNSGAAAAANVHVDDLLAAALTYNATSDPSAAGWTFTVAGNDVDADLASLAGGGSAFFWIRAQVK